MASMRAAWALVVLASGCATVTGLDEFSLADDTCGRGQGACGAVAVAVCPGLPATCGPGGDEDCCAVTAVPGGAYHRSNDPNAPATVSDFLLDRFEITVGRFRAFVAAYPGSKPVPGAGAHPLIAGTGWDPLWDTYLPADQQALTEMLACNPTYQTWTNAPISNENRPMNCIDWFLAFAFCAWDGGRLPTEAEWNYAAAGGAELRQYPWSNPPADATIDGSRANYDCTGDGSPSELCAASDVLDVGSKSPAGDGKWGHADLGGGLWEWSMDWYGPYATPCNDCINAPSNGERVWRGGSWQSGAPQLLSTSRIGGEPLSRGAGVGGRCARAP